MSAPGARRPTWLVPVVVLVLAFAAAVGIAARGLYQERDRSGESVPAQQRAEWGGEPTDNTRVALSPDALAHPEHENVRQVLQAYFDAINSKDHAAWAGTVVEERSAEKTEDAFRTEYASTTDSDAFVYRINSTGEGTLQVLLRFASRQRPDDAPSDAPRGCLWWRAAYNLVAQDGWKLDDEGATALHQSC